MTQILQRFVNEGFTIDFFCAEMEQLTAFVGNKSIVSVCVAVSGGADSTALLLLSAEWAKKNGVNVYAVTVDHKLRPESTREAEIVKEFCRSRGIRHKTIPWNRECYYVRRNALENLAREARYQLMSEFCKHHNISVLLVGHTWNDQLETFEMRLNAGSTACGLAGMSQVRSLAEWLKLFRPILHFSKEHLEDFLKSQNISWITDPMNDQDFFLRVFYRKKIIQYGEDKILNLSKDIIQLGKRRNEIETAAVYFLKKFCEFSECGYVMVKKDKLLLEEKAVQAEILKRVIWNVGGKKYAKTISKSCYDQIFCKKINTLGGCLWKIKKDKIFFFRENRRNFGKLECGLSLERQNNRLTSGFVESNSPCLNKINIFDVFL
ncbi:MAG: tRNA lysidine(34) synthetase TilS [Holosporaceae bacterium]|jgi:tRNA(Ile)-lysidine synthase|nr:tRNA lysidine(34) synthetase TilS [Holosporaceae bacterium]